MTFLAFIAVALVLAITPGPGMAYVVARTAAGGRQEGLASCVGTGLGGLVHVLAAAFGLSALIARSAWAFNVVKYVGAAYLVYLGVRMLRRRGPEAAQLSVTPQGVRKAFLEGILVEALNIKTALFFVAFLPSFTDPTQALAPQLIVLGSTCVAINTLVDVIAVWGANRLLQSDRAKAARTRILQRVSGCTMVVLGVVLASARRSG